MEEETYWRRHSNHSDGTRKRRAVASVSGHCENDSRHTAGKNSATFENYCLTLLLVLVMMLSRPVPPNMAWCCHSASGFTAVL